MRILVTGGAGYVGSVVVQQLRLAGHDVWVLDSLIQGHRDAVWDGAHLVVGDIGDSAMVGALLTEHKIEAVAHLAAATVVSRSLSEPRFFYEENVLKPLTLLHTMLDCGVKRLVFSSTASVFGEPQFVPVTEDHPRIPISAYGDSKLAFEKVLDHYGTAYGLRSVVFRFFNAAGSSDGIGEDHRPETHVIPLMLRAMTSPSGAPFRVYGSDYGTPDGTCIRDYVHVKDLAQAHLRAVEGIDRIEHGRYNLGSGQGISIRQLIECARQVTGLELPVEYHGRRPGDPSVLVASPDRARKELRWEPVHSDPATILSSAWDWFIKNPDGYAA